jgi:hypothetical protein
MLSFNGFLTEEKNLHMEHLEDEVLNSGIVGTRGAINFLQSLRDMLAGNVKSSVNVTVKWDGCVHEDTVVLTNDGDKTIREIVESDKLLSVIGNNLEEQIKIDKSTPIIDRYAKDGNKEWVEVVFENGESIKVTEDHELYTTNRGWVKAIELNENDDIKEL